MCLNLSLNIRVRDLLLNYTIVLGIIFALKAEDQVKILVKILVSEFPCCAFKIFSLFVFVFVLFCFFTVTTSLPPFRDMLSFLGFVRAMSGVVLCLSKVLLFVFFAGLLCFLTLLAFLQNYHLLKYNTIIKRKGRL